jgi:hypothetical protein
MTTYATSFIQPGVVNPSPLRPQLVLDLVAEIERLQALAEGKQAFGLPPASDSEVIGYLRSDLTEARAENARLKKELKALSQPPAPKKAKVAKT